MLEILYGIQAITRLDVKSDDAGGFYNFIIQDNYVIAVTLKLFFYSEINFIAIV
jgi:hypothetical protein